MLSPLASLASNTVQATLRGIEQTASVATSAFASLLPTPPTANEDSAAADRRKELQQSLRERLNSFHAKLTPRLRDSGIQRVPPILLNPDGFGGVHVDIDHPQFATIEALFERDPALRQEFREITEAASELHAATYQESLRQSSISVAISDDHWSLSTPASVLAADSPLRMQKGIPTP